MPTKPPTWEDTVEDTPPKWEDTEDISPAAEPPGYVPESPAAPLRFDPAYMGVPMGEWEKPMLEVPASIPKALIKGSMALPTPNVTQLLRLLPPAKREEAIQGIAESAASGASSLTSPGGIGVAAGLAAAPQVVLPAMMIQGASQVPAGVQAVRQAEGVGPTAKAAADLAQTLAMVAGPVVPPVARRLQALRRPPVIPIEQPPIIPPAEPPIIPPDVKPVEPVAEPVAPAAPEPFQAKIVDTDGTLKDFKVIYTPDSGTVRLLNEATGAKHLIHLPSDASVSMPQLAEMLSRGMKVVYSTSRDYGTVTTLEPVLKPTTALPAAPAAETKGVENAPQERQVQESVLGERERTEAQRIPAETSPRDSLQPTAPVGETPPKTLPNALARESVLGEPPSKTAEGKAIPSQVVQPKPPVSEQTKSPTPLEPTKQKKYLLTEIRRAIVEAPGESKVTPHPRHDEAAADLKIIESVEAQQPTVEKMFPKEPGSYSWHTTEEHTAASKATEEWYSGAEKQIQPLLDKWGIVKKRSEGYPTLDPEHPESPVEQHPSTMFRILKEKLNEIIGGIHDTVTIDIPGDGTFEVRNTKSALRDFEKRAEKFPVKPGTMKASSKPRTEATEPAKLVKARTLESDLKAIEPFRSESKERRVLGYAFSDGTHIVATDGRRLTIVDRKGFGGTPQKPVMLDETGKVAKFAKGQEPGTIPNWNQVIPDPSGLKPMFLQLDTARVFNLLKQAIGVLGDRSRSVAIWRDGEGRFGLTASNIDFGEYATGITKTSRPVMTLNGDYLLEAIQAARKLGSDKVDLFFSDELSPLVIQGKGWKHVLMPMRMEGATQGAVAHPEYRPPSSPPPAAETGEKGPGIVGMGGAVAPEFARTGGSPAATKFRMMDEARVKRGLEPLLKPESVSDEATLNRALAEYDRDPAGADVLADELIKNPKPIEDWQNHYLLLRWIDTRDQFYRSAKEAQLADADGRMADLAAANGQTERWSQAMTKLEKALRLGGSETGRALRARRVMIAEDFSLAGLEAKKRSNLAASGLSPEEVRKQMEEGRAELVKLANQYKATAESLEKDLATSRTRVAQLEAQREIDKAIKEAPLPYDKRILDYAERFVVKLEDAAKPAAARLRERLSRMSVGVDPTIIADAAIVGSAKLARIGLNKARWIDAMVADFTEKIRPMLDDIWTESNRLLEENLKPVPEKVKTTVRKIMSVGERKAAIEAQIQEKILKGKLNDLQPVLRKYERVLAEQGIRNRDVMIDTIHAFASKFDPRFTRDMTMDAISGYGDFRPLTKDEIDVVLRDLHQQYQQLGKLRDMAAGQAPKRTGFQRQAPSDEGRRLIQQVEEAKRRGGYTVTDPEAQLRSALDAAKKRLTDQIADLDHQIQTRQKIVKNRTKLQYDDEYNKLKAIRDEKKALFDEVFPKAPITEAQRLEAWNRHIDRRMAELQERIKNKDFSKKVRRPPPTLGPKELEKQDIMARLQEQFHELLLRDKYKNMHGAQKAYMLAKEAMNIPRNVMTSADVSAVLRQGGILSASHPVIAARALVPMFKGMASERMAGIIDQEILSRPNAKSGRYAQAKLYLAPLRSTTLSAMEEQIMSRFAHRIPLVRASNRAFITFLNRLRADSFDAFTEALETKGAPLNEAELKAIANYINITTGRGDLGARYNAGAELAATVLFSPRLVTSRFQFLAGQPLYRGSARTRALVAQEYGRSLTALAVFLGLGYLAGGTVELDPRSSDFGKLRFGNTRLDPMAGLSQSAVFLSRTGAAAANVLAETLANRKLLAGETKTVKGKVRMLGGPKVGYGQKDFADVVLTFLRSKFAPVPGSLIDILSRKNMVGEKVTPGDVIGRFEPLSETALGRATGIESEIPVPVPGTFTMPLSMQDAFNVMKEHGVARGIALEVLSLFGMGLQYFDPSQTRRK